MSKNEIKQKFILHFLASGPNPEEPPGTAGLGEEATDFLICSGVSVFLAMPRGRQGLRSPTRD